MSSGKEYLDFILEQLSEAEDVSYRAMMGEYILYYKGKKIDFPVQESKFKSVNMNFYRLDL